MKHQIAYIISELKTLGSPERAEHSKKFFKTNKGDYGEGDVFCGANVPQMRSIARKYHGISIGDAKELLHSKLHEARLVALLILIHRFERSDASEKKRVYNLYLANTKWVNNWDLVDSSAHKIVGAYLYTHTNNNERIKILYKLANSKNLWERRVSIISTAYFIGKDEFDTTIKVSEILVNDNHDLIHKAVGWMLREVGKREKKAEIKFLDRFYRTMPRTMLRYAIERFSKKEKKHYMKK